MNDKLVPVMEKIDDNSCKHCDFIGSIFGSLLDSDPYSEGTGTGSSKTAKNTSSTTVVLFELYGTVYQQ